jgi:hypothetical protein
LRPEFMVEVALCLSRQEGPFAMRQLTLAK